MNNKKIYIKKDVIFGLLDYCKSLHPVEGILLLQGTHVKEKIEVDRLMIPPLPTHSEEFSSFDQYQLPLDSSILMEDTYSDETLNSKTESFMDDSKTQSFIDDFTEPLISGFSTSLFDDDFL